jgi:hypothetical protein
MINELEDVILPCDLPEHGLSAGDIGTALLVHRNAAGYEVEFTSPEGDTMAVVTLIANQVPSSFARHWRRTGRGYCGSR